MIDRFERFSFAISEIFRYWHKIATDEMEKYGLKGPYAVYLTTLCRHDEGITSAELSELCSRDKSDVSRAMSVMEGKNLVERESASTYRARLRLTKEGKSLAEHINERAKVAVEEGGRGLSDKDREVFYRSLELIVSNLQKLSEQGLPS